MRRYLIAGSRHQRRLAPPFMFAMSSCPYSQVFQQSSTGSPMNGLKVLRESIQLSVKGVWSAKAITQAVRRMRGRNVEVAEGLSQIIEVPVNRHLGFCH